MQTFLPYPDFAATAAVLDTARLGKQRVEAMMILRYLRGLYRFGSWRNHPATLMWRGYEDALRVYLYQMIREWTRRGHKNTIRVRLPAGFASGATPMPWWLGDERLHSSHRAALLY
ncbi:MAG: MSMEG_6728 family protein, partial [bacterium]